jgi:hypothetical protein
MSVQCKICRHPQRAAIDLALFNGGSVRGVSAQFGFEDFSAIARHRPTTYPMC